MSMEIKQGKINIHVDEVVGVNVLTGQYTEGTVCVKLIVGDIKATVFLDKEQYDQIAKWVEEERTRKLAKMLAEGIEEVTAKTELGLS